MTVPKSVYKEVNDLYVVDHQVRPLSYVVGILPSIPLELVQGCCIRTQLFLECIVVVAHFDICGSPRLVLGQELFA